jgi:hypothetical protein
MGEGALNAPVGAELGMDVAGTFVAARGPAPCVNAPDQPHQHQTMRLALLISLALYFVFVATSQPERHFIL